jgi:hypothetical protein
LKKYHWLEQAARKLWLKNKKQKNPKPAARDQSFLPCYQLNSGVSIYITTWSEITAKEDDLLTGTPGQAEMRRNPFCIAKCS